MRISNPYASQAPVETTRVDSRRASEDHDHASFSAIFEDQTKLGSVATALHQSSEQREARVAQLRQQYLDGTYHVDASSLSSKIVNDHTG